MDFEASTVGIGSFTPHSGGPVGPLPKLIFRLITIFLNLQLQVEQGENWLVRAITGSEPMIMS